MTILFSFPLCALTITPPTHTHTHTHAASYWASQVDPPSKTSTWAGSLSPSADGPPGPLHLAELAIAWEQSGKLLPASFQVRVMHGAVIAFSVGGLGRGVHKLGVRISVCGRGWRGGVGGPCSSARSVSHPRLSHTHTGDLFLFV